MATCSLLLDFLKQALESCHVFIFHNTLTSTPPWLTHTESQKPWMVVYSHQLDDRARGSQHGWELGNLEKVRHVDLSANKAASTCFLLDPLRKSRVNHETQLTLPSSLFPIYAQNGRGKIRSGGQRNTNTVGVFIFKSLKHSIQPLELTLCGSLWPD